MQLSSGTGNELKATSIPRALSEKSRVRIRDSLDEQFRTQSELFRFSVVQPSAFAARSMLYIE